MQTAINTLGSTYVAAVAAGSKLFQLLCCPFDALGSTMSVYSGQNAGACAFSGSAGDCGDSSLIGLVYSILAFAAMLLFAPQQPLLFLDPEEENLTQLVQLTSQYIRVLSAFFFPWPW